MMDRATVLKWTLRLAAIGIGLGAWLYAVGPGDVSPFILPDIPTVLGQFLDIVVDPEIWTSAALTIGEFLAAFALASLAGLLLGFFASRSRLRLLAVDPMLQWGYMAPLALLFPVFILWFGVGISSKILFAALAGFFPIAINTLRGLSSVREHYLRTGRAYGASATQLEYVVKLPAGLPLVLSGIRIGAALCLINVILGEMLASQAGLGYKLAEASQTLNTARALAIVMLLILVVAVVQIVLARIVGRATPAGTS